VIDGRPPVKEGWAVTAADVAAGALWACVDEVGVALEVDAPVELELVEESAWFAASPKFDCARAIPPPAMRTAAPIAARLFAKRAVRALTLDGATDSGALSRASTASNHSGFSITRTLKGEVERTMRDSSEKPVNDGE
jgi:hypothetical protein